MLKKTFLFTKIQILSSFKRPSFLATPILLGISLLTLFSFSMRSEALKEESVSLGTLWGILEFVSVLSLTQCFHLEKEGKVVDTILTSQKTLFPYFLGKSLGEFLKLTFIFLSVISTWIILYNINLNFSLPFLFILVLFSLSTATLGVLLQSLVMKSLSREILFPLLFFPLHTSVLMAASSLTFQILTGNSVSNEAWWNILILYPVMNICFFVFFGKNLLKS